MSEFRGTVLTGQELVHRRTKNESILPVRGPKQFIRTHSWLEEKQLQSLLDATKDLLAEERVERESVLARAEWDESLKIARVTRIVGHHFEKFGHEEGTTVFLYPEEALYLLEMNNLEILFGGVSMSIQQAYMVLLNSKVGCTFQEYIVFSHLLKNGFKVLRHCPKRTVTRYERLIGLYPARVSNKKLGGKNKRIIQHPSVESDNQIKVEKNVNDMEEKDVVNSVKDKKLKNHKHIKDDSESVRTVENILCAEVTVDGNSSSFSDIEILSEKSVGNNKYDNDLDLNDDCSSFSVSEDSDCQVVFSKAPTSQEINSDKHSIEEINLSDSDDSVQDVRRHENAVKTEPVKLEETNIFAVQNSKLNSKSSVNLEDNLSLDCNNDDSFVENNCDQVVGIKETIIETKSSSNMTSCSEQTFPVAKKSSHVSVDTNMSLVNSDSVLSINEIVKSPISQEAVSNKCLVKEESMCENSFLTFEGKVYSSETEDNLDERIKSSKDLDKIEVIDLDDEPRISEDRWTILNSFPNAAGCSVVHCEVPPSHLCPPEVEPIRPTYAVILERLEDPRFGGSHKAQKNNEKTYEKRHRLYRFHRNMPHRLANIPPSRPYNRRFHSRPRFRGHRHRGRHSYNQDVRFPNNSYPPGSLMYPPIYNNCTSQTDHSSFPPFSEQSFQPSFDYNRHIPRWRDHQRSADFNQYPSENEYHPQSPQQHSYPRRQTRGSRTPLDYNRRDGHNTEASNNEDGGFIPFNIDSTNEEMSHEQSSGAQVHKRRKDRSEESNNNSCSRGKYPRKAKEKNFTSYQSINSVRDFINSRNSEGQITGSSNSRTRSGAPILPLNPDTESSSSSDTYSSDESSCSEVSDDSAEESMDDEPKDENIHELLKPENLKDIDIALKSLHLVKSAEVQNVALSDEPLLSIKYDLYLPSTHFRKSEPPLPDYRLVIMSPDQRLPTSRQLSFLEEGFEDDVPLLFAVASFDSVSFFLHSRVNLPEVSSKEKVQCNYEDNL